MLKPSLIRVSRLRRDGAEEGYVLVAVIFMMALLVLSLSVAVPRIRQDIQRDRELETIERGRQYIRAVRLYYRKFHRYPPSVDALENTDNIRFLRKRYDDPITGKDDWQSIGFGANKVPTTMVFGKPIEVAQTAGTGPGGANASATPNGTPNPNTTADPTLGRVGIIGFSLPSDKESILSYKLQKRYNLWEFVYDPLQEMSLAGGRPGQGPISQLPPWDPHAQGGPGQSGEWGPDGNLPTPTNPNGGTPANPRWGPNGNLPAPPSTQP